MRRCSAGPCSSKLFGEGIDSFENKRLPLLIFLFVSLLGMAMAVSALHTSQSSAEASYIQYTTTTPNLLTTPDISTMQDFLQAPLTPPVPTVKYLEVDRYYNYHIPSDEEVASRKQELKAGKKFKDKANKVGQQQAEQDLDTEFTRDVNYMKEKNQLGSEKIPLIEIGEHSAYISKY